MLSGVTVVLVLHASFAGEFGKTLTVLPLSSLLIAQSLILAQLGVREEFRSGVYGTPTCFVNGARYDADWNIESLLGALQQVGKRRSPGSLPV